MQLSHKQIVDMITPDDAEWKRPVENRKFGIISQGAMGHAESLCKHVLEDESLYWKYTQWESFRKSVEIPVMLGMFYQDREQRNISLRCADLNIHPDNTYQRPMIIYWVGTDVMNLYSAYKMGDSNYVKALQHPNIIHVAVSRPLKEELEVFFDDVRYLPLPCPITYNPMPITPYKRVAIYIPRGRADFFYQEYISDIAKRFPDVDFLIYGSNRVKHEAFLLFNADNVWDVGRMSRDEMERFIATISVYLRLTIHDGLPQSVQEFILAGRQVIFNHPDIMNVQYYIDLPEDFNSRHPDYENKLDEIEFLLKRALIEDVPDVTMAEAYRDTYSHEKFRDGFYQLIEEARSK